MVDDHLRHFIIKGKMRRLSNQENWHWTSIVNGCQMSVIDMDRAMVNDESEVEQ